MTEELGSTNIQELINEDTDINDDMVNRILNELENSDEINNENTTNNENIINSESDKDFSFNNQKMDFDNSYNYNPNPNFNESENTVNKINTIIEEDTGSQFLYILTLINDLRLPIIVFILSIIIHNNFINNLLINSISKILKNTFLINNIALFIRAIIISVIVYYVKSFI